MKNRRKHQGQVIGTGEKVFNAGMAILGIVISLVVLYPIYYVLIASPVSYTHLRAHET